MLKRHDALGWLVRRCTAWGRIDLGGSAGRAWGVLSLLARLCGCRSRRLSRCLVVASVVSCLLRGAIPATGLAACRVSGR
jgi:hypothetical protein